MTTERDEAPVREGKQALTHGIDRRPGGLGVSASGPDVERLVGAMRTDPRLYPTKHLTRCSLTFIIPPLPKRIPDTNHDPLR
jgi:hypothetical protein